MPGVSKTQRAEAKYNVVTEFPHLGLHSAAATGNVGLVKYALDHGQPINSVVDGVLALHVACSGGSDLVVRLLIEKGADVNAPRLPRRYFNDKHRDTSAPIIGTSGSTPLHFAGANGHGDIVLTLLLHGARPDLPDKHGVTAEMVARQNGWDDCANLLKEWTHNKDRDLREREANSAVVDLDHHRNTCDGSNCLTCGSSSARLRVKRSIDNALNILRPSVSQASGSPIDRSDTSLATIESRSSTSVLNSNGDLPPRRPSLPHVFESPEGSPLSASTPVSSRSHTSRSSRRPRSAGAGAESSGGSHRLKGKISLLSIFKKSISDTPSTPESFSTYDSSSSTLNSVPSSPPPDERPSLSARSSSQSRVSQSPHDSFVGAGPATRFRNRMLSESQPNSGVMRPHYRTLSSGESQSDRLVQSKQSSMRALRFDSSSTNMSDGPRISDRARRSSPSPARQLTVGAALTVSRDNLKQPRDSPRRPPLTAEPEDLLDGDIEEDHEEQYGEMIAAGEVITADASPAPDPVASPISGGFDCPFSINRAPTEDSDVVTQVDSLVSQVPDTRGRGDSVSSMGTDASGNPTSSSGASVHVLTPAVTAVPLPAPRISSPTRIIAEGIIGQTYSPDAEEPSEYVSTDRLEKAHALTRPRVPVDIDIRSISSHAQAEALVQRTQKSILEMQDLMSGRGLGAGRSPLSAKLAAYGESLALERKLKKEEQERSTPSTASSLARNADPTFSRLQAARLAELAESGSGKPLDRKFSLEERKGGSRSSPRRRMRRPHTAGGTPSSEILYSSPPRSGGAHQQSPSLQITLTTPPSDSTSMPGDCTSSVTPPRRSHLHVHSDSRSSPRPRVPRSRTPDPGPKELDLGDPYPIEHIPLSRCSTAPERDGASASSVSKRDRQAARATKLAKMGFSSTDYQNPVGRARVQSTAKPLFGGIKTFVQSLKTKS